jgi:hypothetical protein
MTLPLLRSLAGVAALSLSCTAAFAADALTRARRCSARALSGLVAPGPLDHRRAAKGAQHVGKVHAVTHTQQELELGRVLGRLLAHVEVTDVGLGGS